MRDDMRLRCGFVVITLDEDLFKDVGLQNACRFVACLPSFFGDVVKKETHHHPPERRPLSCSTPTGMMALTTVLLSVRLLPVGI
jgi:hypothetical protein